MVLNRIFFILILTAFSFLAMAQEQSLIVEIGADKKECKFSHKISERDESNKSLHSMLYYTCSKGQSKTIMVRIDNVKDGQPTYSDWSTYSLENGKFKKRAPEKVTTGAGELLLLSGGYAGEINVDPEYVLLSSATDSNGKFFWEDTPIDVKKSAEFQDFQKSMSDTLGNRLENIKNATRHDTELKYKESDGKTIECKRYEGKKSEECPFFQCTDDTLLYLDLDDATYTIKLGESEGALRYPLSVELPRVGEVSVNRMESEYSEKDFYSYVKNPYSQRSFLLKKCNDPKLTSFLLKEENVLKKIIQVEEQTSYKMLVQNIDGLLTTVASTDPVPKNYCQYEDVYYNKAETSLKEVKGLLEKQSKNKVYSMKRAQKVFDYFKAQEDIPWGYAKDGCYARAHIGALRVEKELGIDMDKVWIHGPELSPKSSPNINWSYHVAASINVKDENGNIVPMVIDPALADRPVTVEEWSALFSPSAAKPLRGTYNKFIYADKKIRPTYTVTGNEVYNIREFSFERPYSAEEKLKSAQDTLKQYSEILQGKKNEEADPF